VLPDRRKDLRISAAAGGLVKEQYENRGQKRGERRLCRHFKFIDTY